MPTYEFRCPDGHTFDRFYRKMSEAQSEVECPECGKLATRQLSAGAGLLFKGSGFYLTDYGKNAHRDSGRTPKRALDSSSGGESASSDAKPAESKPAESSSKDSKAADSKPSSTTPASSSGTKPEK
ncbi:MAG TPA: zinc ribbon domain-containing protein [Gemmatimonadaceae bacterium]